MKLTYTMQGDYLIPDLMAPESPKVSKYGMLRHSYLRNHRRAYYHGLLLSGELNSHLEEVDQQANVLMANLLLKMAKAQGVTEELKAKNQMLWVQLMNNIRSAAEEIVLKEIVYS